MKMAFQYADMDTMVTVVTEPCRLGRAA